MIRVLGRASSSNVQAVVWALAELDVPFERIDAGEGYTRLDSPEFLALNPNARIPVLIDGDLTLFESAAIIRYLCHAHAPDSFWPGDLKARADVDKWAEWAKQEIANRFTGPIFWRVVRTPEPRRDWDAIRDAIAKLERPMAVAEARLAERPYLAGEDFTAADIVFGHVLFRYFDIDIERADFPNVATYYTRLTQRPLYQRHVMINYDALRDTI